MIKHSYIRKPAIVAVILASTLALSGCFGSPLDQFTDTINEGINDDLVEGVIEGLTDGNVDIQTGGVLPDDFPAGVPIIEGRIEMATGVELESGKTWMIAVAVADANAAFAQARMELEAAGFEVGMWKDTGMSMLGIFTKDPINVMVGAMNDPDEEQMVSYQVSVGTAEG